LIDIGVPHKALVESLDLSKISHILLTHIHGDHFRSDTIRKVFVNTDAVFVCGEWLEDELLKIGVEKSRIMTVESGRVYDVGLFKISPVVAYHDVENFGYRLIKDGHKHLHVTDTSTLDGIEANGYHSATIECNHDEQRALEMIDEADKIGEFSHLKGAMNSHLSVQKALQFCKDNGIKKLYPVHIGNSTKKEVIEALKRW
jgi:L-ascorbate metabolism protein UlaG (beta-lactamase superfamily)